MRTATTTSAGPRLSQMSLHGRFAPSVMNTRITTTSVIVATSARMSRSWLRVHPEPEAIHVADDQSGEERARGSRCLPRSRSRSSRPRRRRRLRSRPTPARRRLAGRRRRARAGSRTPIPSTVEMPRSSRKSMTGSATRGVAARARRRRARARAPRRSRRSAPTRRSPSARSSGGCRCGRRAE